MIRRLVAALTFLLVLVFWPSLVRAQATNATITGFVTDPAKALIAGAKVDVINMDTNIHYTATSNQEGSYTVPNLPPGPYRIEVEKPGFKTVVKSDLILHIQDTAAINFEMAVGSVSETVTVQAGGLVMNTTDAAVSTVVDRQFAENLPMNGRSFQTLIQLTPGVVVVPTNIVDAGQFSINGQRASSNYWMVDGVSANIGAAAGGTPGNGFGGTLGSFSAFGGTNSLVSVDAMQEFRIQTSTYAPEFGRTPGGQISIVTRSGTNQFHGTAFDYLRNSIFDASDWFNGYTNNPPLPKAEDRQNDFGGTFSGPIFKDKTFFFFSYEGLRLRLPQTSITTVPDVTARQNAIPAMQPYLNAFPLPTPGGADNTTTGVAQFDKSYSNAGTLDAYSLRVDHKLNSALSIFGRYNYSPSEITERGAGVDALSVVTPSRITVQTATVGMTWALSTEVANDLRFNYSRTDASGYEYLDGFGGAVPLASLSFPSPYNSQNAQLNFNLFDLTGSHLLAGHSGSNLQRQINLTDNLSLQKGRHSLKFGVDFRRLSPQFDPYEYSQLVFFRSVAAAETGTPEEGVLQSNTQVTMAFRNLGMFAQDTWHLAPRLTLTYGFRWDVDFAPTSLNGPAIPAVTGYNLNDFSNLSIAPAGTAAFKTTYGNVAPRIGLAYEIVQNPRYETVLRGGFGVFYDLVSSETGSIFGSYPPFGGITFVSAGGFPFSPAESVAPPILPTGNLSFVTAFNPNLKLPYTLQWNIAIEQALGRQQTISASYIGAAGHRLLQETNVASPASNPNIGEGAFIDNTATSNYNALQIQFQRRLSQGLQVLASYTWAHSLDDASAGSDQYSANAGIPGTNSRTNWGPSDFDIRNAFSAGITYDLPAPKMNAFANAILRGWSTQSVIQARSAPPVDISDQNFGGEFDNGILADTRPDFVPGQPYYLYGAQCAAVFQVPVCPGGKGFNPNAFMDPPTNPTTGLPTRQGDVPRNSLRAFGATQWDFAVHRDFPIRESLKLQFRAEMFNVLNHPNFGPPSGGWPFAPFGVSIQTLGQSLAGSSLGAGGFDPLYQIGGPRSMQMALKLMF
jgi:hypothetical protein